MLSLKAIAKLTASYIKKHLPSMHKTHTGLSDAQAEIEYLKVCKNTLLPLSVRCKIYQISVN